MAHRKGIGSRKGRKRRSRSKAIAASGGLLMGAEALRRARKRSHTRRNEELGTGRWRNERHHVKADLHEERWEDL